MAAEAIDYDSYFDDDDFEGLDEETLQRLDSAPPSSASVRRVPAPVQPPPAPRPVQRPVPPIVRPQNGAKQILRPPQQQQQRAQAPTAGLVKPAPAHGVIAPPNNVPHRATGPPPGKKPRVAAPVAVTASIGTDKHGRPWVAPNPFHHRANASPAPPPAPTTMAEANDDMDEDMPHILLNGSQGYVAASAQGKDPPPQPPPNRDFSALKQWGEPSSKIVSPALRSPAGGAGAETGGSRMAAAADARAKTPAVGSASVIETASGETDEQRAMRLEIDALRKEKADLAATLAQTEARAKKAEADAQRRGGEVNVIRQRHARQELHHQAQIEDERKIKAALAEKMEAREKEFKKQMEKLQLEDAFRRQETETSVRRPPGSQWPGSASRPRASSVAPNRRQGVPASPSVGRGARAGSAVAQAQAAPRFPGFQNSFQQPSFYGNDSSRAGSMPPPSIPIDRRKKAVNGTATTPEKTRTVVPNGAPPLDRSAERRKNQSKMMAEETLHEQDEDEDMDVDGEGDWAQDGEDDFEDDGEITLAARAVRDLRAEITSALFTHVTFSHFDNESAIAPTLSASQRPSSLSRSLLNGRLSGTASTFRPAGTHGAFSSRSMLVDLPASPSHSATPVPTFHALTNLRFPPGTESAVVAEHESLCRELFTLLGRRAPNPNGAAAADTSSALDTYLFVGALAHCLELLARLFEKTGIIGPLISILSLISTLVMLFAPFAEYYLGGAMMAQAADHSGSAPPPSKLMALLARIVKRYGRPIPPAEADSSTGKGRAKERSRRTRGVVMRSAKHLANGKNAAAAELDDAVPLEQGKRVALLARVVELLEGLAWRADQVTEEQFGPLLSAERVVSTLLDPVQPPALLNSTLHFLSLLACRPSLFRQIIAIPFAPDHADVRFSKLPLFDRMAWLLARAHGGGRRTRAVSNQTGKAGGTTSDAATSSSDSDADELLTFLVISIPTLLLPQHSDAPLLLLAISSSSRSAAASTGSIGGGSALLPELLDALTRDVHVVYSSSLAGAGSSITGSTRGRLFSAMDRIATIMRMLYVLASTSATLGQGTSDSVNADAGGVISLSTVFQESNYAGLHDRFVVALGTVAFAGVPEWADEMDDGLAGDVKMGPSDGARAMAPRELLIEMSYLAQDLLEDVVSPEEAEDMERCFVVDSDSEEDGGKAEQCVLDPGDTMILIDEDDEAEEQRQQLERES